MNIVSNETYTHLHTKNKTLSLMTSEVTDSNASYIRYINEDGLRSIHSVDKGVLRSICYINSKKVSQNDTTKTRWFLQQKPTLSFNVQLNS
jgi:hypothetical protein